MKTMRSSGALRSMVSRPLAPFRELTTSQIEETAAVSTARVVVLIEHGATVELVSLMRGKVPYSERRSHPSARINSPITSIPRSGMPF
jgi:hypothetical protein